METKLCSKCGKVKPLTEYHKYKSGNRKGFYRPECILCLRKRDKNYGIRHRKEINEKQRKRKYSQGAKPARENKACPKYLGVVIAETVLSTFFDHLEHMPDNTPGYDFICGKGYKIDVKASTLHSHKPKSNYWLFGINKNQIADYFLCLAFDNRESLQPLHIWLIPGAVINTKQTISIADISKTLSKWQPYEKPLDKVIHCCNLLRDTEETIYL